MQNGKHGLKPMWAYVFLLCFLWLLPTSSFAAEKTYQMTEAELVQLETNLNRLEMIAQESKNESEKQKSQLTVLKSQLGEADSLLMKQKASLENANKLLKQYEEEQKKAKRHLKRERTVWMTVAGLLLVRCIAK